MTGEQNAKQHSGIRKASILTREERIANAHRFAPENDVQAREGLALGELITINADMLSMLTDDWKDAVADAAALRAIIRRAVEDVEKMPHAAGCAEQIRCCNCGHDAAIARLKEGLGEK
jgi:hypothetical protein